MKTAVYSTLYPAMLPYLEVFLESLARQDDKTFDLWLGLDGISQETAESQLTTLGLGASFVVADNDSIASLRERSLLRICACYDSVILLDSDDVLVSSRVSRAKEALKTWDVYACALTLIDQQGKDLGLDFVCETPGDWESYLSRANVFGFSNSAYRSEVLRRCFPIPRDTVIVDWLVVSQALALGSSLYFDPEPQMLYRQYEHNTARVLSPFSPEQLSCATLLVLQHYRYLMAILEAGQGAESFQNKLVNRQSELKKFFQMMQDAEKRQTYTTAINHYKNLFCWWEMLAHPDLEYLWQ